MTTLALRIIQSTASIPGWMASYVVTQPTVEPTIIGLPVALWVTVETMIDGVTRQEIRPYVINRHGQIADYLGQPPALQFLCISPPNEDWTANARIAFDDHLRQRVAATAIEQATSKASDN